MYGTLRISAIAGSSTIFAKGANSMWHFNTTSEKYQKESTSMTIMSSQEFAEGRVKDTSAINKSIMNSGIKELLNVS